MFFYQATRETSLTQMITLLERYTNHLSLLRSASSGPSEGDYTTREGFYDMSTDTKLPQELGEFGHVYQVHCPKITMNNTTRDVSERVSSV